MQGITLSSREWTSCLPEWTVMANKHVYLRSQDVDLEHFIEQLLANNEATENVEESSRLNISYDLVQDMLDSMDSKWDKKVLKFY